MRSCLIIDDSETVRLTIAAAVRAARKGVMDMHYAENSEMALQLFAEHRPDVVFLDMMLAGDDPHAPDGQPARGLGILRSMLASRPDLPVVVVTGLAGSQPDVVDAISLGAIAALRKPVKPEEVKYVLDAIDPDKSSMDYFA
jgi:two-component system chemotaxis response regulator CheY